MMSHDTHLIFDLDGTLTDPRQGITRCYMHALEQLAVPAPEAEQLERFIGPGLREVFAELLATTDAERIELAVKLYRERFGTIGLFENSPYPEVRATLDRLAAAGFQCWVCTSKPHVFAQRILEHFGLAACFRGVYGDELDGRFSDKADLLAQLLAREAVAPTSAIMIGDRKHDVRAALRNGTRCIAVSYGFGELAELHAAGATVTCAQFCELPDVIAGLVHS